MSVSFFFSMQIISNSTWCSLSNLNCPTCFPTMTAFATTIRQSHEIIYINDHATRTTRMTRNAWSTMCRGGGSKVSLKLWSRSFPMRDSISCSNFSKASANAGWFEIYKDLQQSWQTCSISIYFIPFLLEETEKQHLKQRLSRRCCKPAPIGCSSTSSSLPTRA